MSLAKTSALLLWLLLQAALRFLLLCQRKRAVMYDSSSTHCVFVAASGAPIRFSSPPTLQLHTVAALGFFLVYIVYSTSAPLLTHPTVIITLHSLHDTTACSVAYFFSNARRHAQQVHVSLACICRCLGLNLHRHFFLRRAIRYNSQNLFPVAAVAVLCPGSCERYCRIAVQPLCEHA